MTPSDNMDTAPRHATLAWKYICKFTSQSMIFGLGGVLGSAVGFLLIPVYTRFLSPADYGVLEILTVTAGLLYVVLSLGMQPAFFRFYVSEEDAVQRRRLAGTLILFFTGINALCLLLTLSFSSRISALLLQTDRYGTLVTLALLGTFLRMVMVTPLYVLRAHQQAWRYAMLNLAHLLVNLLCNVWFIVACGWGVKGILAGNLVSTLAFCLVGIAVTRRWFQLAFSPRMLMPVLRFGAPLVLATFGIRGIQQLDRFVVQLCLGSEPLGLLALADRFARIVTILVVTPFLIAWGPLKWEMLREEAKQNLFRLVFRAFAGVALSAAVILGIFARELVGLVAAPAFLAASQMVPALAVAAVLHGVQDIFSTGIQVRKQTGLISLAVLTGLLLKGVLALLCVPRWGITGAAWSTLGAYAGLCAVVLLLSQRCYAIDYGLRRVTVYGGWSLLTWLSVFWLQRSPVSIESLFIAKIAIVFVYLAGTWVLLVGIPAPARSRLMRWQTRLTPIEEGTA